MSARLLDPVWETAKPLEKRLYQVAREASSPGNQDLFAHLRRAMGSAMACLRDAQAHLGNRMACAYLSGAERMVNQVMDDLHQADEQGCAGIPVQSLLQECQALAQQIHKVLYYLPEASRDTIVMNDYASLNLPRRFA